MVQLTCENLTLGYGGVSVIKDLSFEVKSGDYLCIVGENGSGKTTLMKSILGLHPKTSGQITMATGLSSTHIGYLPQQTLIQRDFPASVWEIVLSGCLSACGWRPFYNAADKQRATQNMERVGITALKKRPYRELSGGQQQRTLLARALCAADKMLLLDEPVAGLDPQAATAMYELIGGLHREGMTIVMVSHDIPATLAYASHVLHIGENCFFGTKSDYLGTDMGKLTIKANGGAPA